MVLLKILNPISTFDENQKRSWLNAYTSHSSPVRWNTFAMNRNMGVGRIFGDSKLTCYTFKRCLFKRASPNGIWIAEKLPEP